MKEHFDHIIDPEHKEYMKGDFVPMPIGFPFYQDTYRALSPFARLDYVTDFFAPWILMFQHGWGRVNGDLMIIDYDDFMNDKEDCIMDMLDFLGEKDISKEKALRAFDADDLRVNKKTPGRGRDALGEDRCKRIEEIRWRLNVEPKDAVSR
jgi:hypothetical protein